MLFAEDKYACDPSECLLYNKEVVTDDVTEIMDFKMNKIRIRLK